jgi:putative hydrolase of the HAD superfamily
MPPQAIYFDLGNVLLGFSHERMCRQMADVAGVSPEAIRKALFGYGGPDGAQWRYETGELDTDGYYAHFCEQTRTRPDRRQLELAACDIFWEIDPMIELVKQLAAAGNRLGILSNINVLHWQFVSDGRFPALHAAGERGDPFQWAVLSYQAGAMKPDRAIYEAAVRRTGAAAGDVLFIDDRAENVAGAKQAGLNAIEFVGIEQLVADLTQRGVRGM